MNVVAFCSGQPGDHGRVRAGAEKDTDGHIRNELVAYNRGKLLAQHGFGIREAQARNLRPGPNAPVARQDGRTGREIVLE